jgi:hypothetical protein
VPFNLSKYLYSDYTDISDAIEKDYSPAQLATDWGVSVETVRSVFRNEPGVLKLAKIETKSRRGYLTTRIPAIIAERLHKKLSP